MHRRKLNKLCRGDYSKHIKYVSSQNTENLYIADYWKGMHRRTFNFCIVDHLNIIQCKSGTLCCADHAKIYTAYHSIFVKYIHLKSNEPQNRFIRKQLKRYQYHSLLKFMARKYYKKITQVSGTQFFYIVRGSWSW